MHMCKIVMNDSNMWLYAFLLLFMLYNLIIRLYVDDECDIYIIIVILY